MLRMTFFFFLIAALLHGAACAVAAAAAGTVASAALSAADRPHGKRDKARYGKQNQDIPDIHFLSPKPERRAEKMNDQRREPGHAALPEHDVDRPAAAQLALDGGDRRHTRRIEQAEHQQRRRRQR